MTTITLANMISQRAAMVTESQTDLIKRGEIKKVLKSLGFDSIEKPKGYTNEQWKSTQSRIISEKWNKIGINLTQYEIKKNL